MTELIKISVWDSLTHILIILISGMENKIKILPEFLPEFNEKQRNANVEPRITLSSRSASQFHVEMAIFVDSVLYRR